MSYSINRLVQNLRDLCADRVLNEKWLIAPSRRVGMQWLDAVARSGQPVLNFRVKTLPALALELASQAMVDRGLELISGIRHRVLTARLYAGLSGGSREYLSGLEASRGLADTLARVLGELRRAGLGSSDLEPRRFEVPAKGRAVKALLAAYERELESAGLVDYPGSLRLAIARLESGAGVTGGQALMMIPDFLEVELRGLESRLWQALPEGERLVLASDAAGDVDRTGTNASLLACIRSPADAPEPTGIDGTLQIFRAVGEVNEVREVLRRCVERGIPFDDVEILHTDSATYVPLIFELCCRLKPEDPASIPVTFYEGVASTYSRPARALLGWLNWISEGYPQSALVDMVTDGLLRFGIDDSLSMSFARLGAILRAVPIGGGRDRYLPAIDRALGALNMQIVDEEEPVGAEDETCSPEERSARISSLRERAAGLEALRETAAGLLSLSPDKRATQESILLGARSFIDRFARRVNEFDQYCYRRLSDEIEAAAGCFEGGDVQGFDPAAWLEALPADTAVEGKGPRPGCLYVSNVRGGGHSGRGHTFIIGLDDTRFPGTGRQDPLLLDAERSRISDELPTGAGRLSREVDDLARTMAGLRGNVTLGYSCRSLEDDRELFPSPVVVSAFRLIGRRDGDQKDLARWAGHPASFAPSDPDRCIDSTEWWLSRTCGDVLAEGLELATSVSFPNLGRGFVARAARSGDDFTEYDGYVPEAGAECDPASPGGPTLSASRLETLAKCPLEYFFRYVLKVEPPEEFEIDPAVWLDRARRGELLHSAFREFMTHLTEKGLKPDFNRDLPLIMRVLDEEVARWEARLPAPSTVVFESEKRELCRISRIFLQEEHEHCMGNRPVYFEASIGLEPEGEGCPLDCESGVEIELPGGRSIRVRGRIDRIDELPSEGAPRFAVWDYKTGSMYGYSREDPFRQGRHLQNALYLELAAARLAELHPGARVVSFGYFFPGTRAHGARIVWDEVELAGARSLLDRLCRMVASGCFPFTDDPENDLKFSDFTPAFGDVEAAAADITRKLANPANEMLRPYRELRALEDAFEGADK